MLSNCGKVSLSSAVQQGSNPYLLPPQGAAQPSVSNLSLCFPFHFRGIMHKYLIGYCGTGQIHIRKSTVPASRRLPNSIDIQSCTQEWDSVASHYKYFCRNPRIFFLVSSCHFRNMQVSHSTSSGHVQVC